MIKILGIVLIIISGSSGGYFASIKLSKKVKFIEEFIEFIQITESEIRYTGRPFSEIAQSHAKNTEFYSYIRTCLELNKKGMPFPTCWGKAFLNVKSEMWLTEEFSQIINNFGRDIGSGDVESQVNYCHHIYNLANSYLKQAVSEKFTKGKLYKVLGTCAGIVVALVFV